MRNRNKKVAEELQAKCSLFLGELSSEGMFVVPPRSIKVCGASAAGQLSKLITAHQPGDGGGSLNVVQQQWKSEQ